MIVDVHTHVFTSPDVFSASFLAEASRARAEPIDLSTRYADYRASAARCDATICFGGKARLAGLWVDDRQDPARLIGFLSVDPTQPRWEEELEYGHQELKLQGIKLMPMYAGFYPQEARLNFLWRYAQQHGLPVLLHTGTTFVSQATLDTTLPRHVDVVARRFPEVRIIMAHLGHPFEGECAVVVRKHPHVYTDISALHYRPWQLFHSLMLVQEYNVWSKVLFGTDYPFTTVDASVAGLRDLAKVQIDRFHLDADQIEAMIERNALPLLGLAHPASQ
ncbi:MAG TPA: amidohydrolase family protein [Caldilineaceae bacterium]|nr:amidohydrolase family protein [Caldilineaceae bacterium]